MTAPERDQEFADLLSAVIERHAVASRLQGTAGLAEEVLADAMRVGDAVRRALRDGNGDRPNEADCERLDGLAGRLEAATDALLAQPLAADLRRAAAAGDIGVAARLALALFAGLERPAAIPDVVYTGVNARRRSRSGETLVHPEALADEIAARIAEGIAPASGDAADEAMLPEPIALTASFEGVGSEIALARATSDIAEDLVEDMASADVLVFSRRLAGPFSVALAAEADDEWWAASSFPWTDYRAQLASALRARNIEVRILG
ncbi:MAG: hypothetical protein U0842_24255 [Candidatus Binatia bacterium]